MRTITGGIAAEIGGGKFSNGALTAAYGYLFNELGDHRRRSSVAAYGEAKFYSGSVDVGGGYLEVDLTVNSYNRDGNFDGYYRVKLDAWIVGGEYGIPFLGFISQPVVLSGPELRSVSDIYSAFNGQPVEMYGFTVSVGAGLSFGASSGWVTTLTQRL